MKLKIPGFELEIDKDDKEFLSKISKSDIVGLLGGDWIHYWRWSNLLKIVKKVKQKSKEYNLDPQQIAPKFLQEFFQQASLEEDEGMQEMWAHLLLNKSSGKDVNIFYINMLKEIEPYEAQMLNALFGQSQQSIETIFDKNALMKAFGVIDSTQLDITIHKFYGFNLLRPRSPSGISMGSESPMLDTINAFRFSEMGLDFCKKCNGIIA